MSEPAARPAPANADFERDVRASFARQGLMGQIGAWLVEVAPGRVVVELPFSPRISQQQGLFHGAVIGAIGDTAGGYAAMTLMPAGSEVLSIEYKINFMRPARGTVLRATGDVLRAGRSVSVARIDVAVGDGQEMQDCAVLQATFMRVEPARG